jgi:hypothetical protein
VPRGDGDRIEPRLAVRDQVAVAHDEAGADAADAGRLVARQAREVIEFEFRWHDRVVANRWRGGESDKQMTKLEARMTKE